TMLTPDPACPPNISAEEGALLLPAPSVPEDEGAITETPPAGQTNLP
ncbi:MAG: hypothetical protein RLZZ403_28, partial [Pseudomonadota bacterium]